jgi:hypothetical protein
VVDETLASPTYIMPVLVERAFIVTDLLAVELARVTLVPAVVTTFLPFNTVVGTDSDVVTVPVTAVVDPESVITWPITLDPAGRALVILARVPIFHVPD